MLWAGRNTVINALCVTAKSSAPDVRFASFATVSLLRRNFRFQPVSEQIADIERRQKGANTGSRFATGNANRRSQESVMIKR